MFGLDQQIILRGRITTIRGELDGAARDKMMLHQHKDDSGNKKYSVVFSAYPAKRVGARTYNDTSDTRAFEISKADFDQLREQGIPNAF